MAQLVSNEFDLLLELWQGPRLHSNQIRKYLEMVVRSIPCNSSEGCGRPHHRRVAGE